MVAMQAPLFPRQDPSVEHGIEEFPITQKEMELLIKMRELLKNRVEEYRQNQKDEQWLKSHGIQHVKHWRETSPRFQNLPNDEGEDAAPAVPQPPAYPWDPKVSALDSPWPDRLLMRYLKARNLDVTQATDMFLKMCIWRDCYGASEMCLTLQQPYRRFWRTVADNSSSHRDKNGRTTYWEKSGKIDPHFFSQNITPDEVVLTHVWTMESQTQKLDENSMKMKRRVDRTVTLIDLAGCGIGHRKVAHLFTLVSQIDQDYYPEMLSKSFMFNSPMLFSGIWSLIRPMLHKNTTDKIQIKGWSGYDTLLCDELGAENVPAEYGGKCQCKGEGKACLARDVEPTPSYIRHSPQYKGLESEGPAREQLNEWRRQRGMRSLTEDEDCNDWTVRRTRFDYYQISQTQPKEHNVDNRFNLVLRA
ncbi:hypothetical protein PROFUN_00469 [Planoprotostelium fungivorum]|uniref:CRAL-TRIO domain-containing protein n=1 Tax=Planoprotostelium fungivorum TaxID=1890364 RepID=A0A2P6N0X2_9EUKA|nr:hypothetical protein PROFUN_00469 [Planoprotostelium fungivorum]